MNNLQILIQILYKLGQGFDKEVLENLVNFVYTGSLDVQHDKIKSLYWAANKLKVNFISKSFEKTKS